MFWNVASALGWDFIVQMVIVQMVIVQMVIVQMVIVQMVIVQMVWWYWVFAHLRTVVLKLFQLAAH